MRSAMDKEWRGPVRLDCHIYAVGQELRWRGVDGQGHYGTIETINGDAATIRCGYATVGFRRGDSVFVPADDLNDRDAR